MVCKRFHTITLLIFSCIVSFSASAMRDVSGKVPSHADIETQELARTYRNFCRSYNKKQPTDIFNKAYEDFEDAIFFPVDQRNSNPNNQNSYDPATFLKRARDILVRIEEEVANPASQVLLTLLQKNIVPLLKNRIDLARLDKNIFDRLGTRGSIDDFTQDLCLRQALSMLTGRLFQVNINTNEIVSTASATMIHWDPTNQKIHNLNKNCNLPLNSILTCAHALNSNDGRSNFYFVQSANLDLATGFPEGINNEADLNLFLLTNGDSFRVGNFTIKNRVNNIFSNINLSMGQPQYFSNEDVIIGGIHLRIPQAFLLYNNGYSVSFKNILPARGDSYFALGYPGCDHYRLKAPIPLLPYPPLIQDMGISPLFITRSTHTKTFPVNANVNGILIHQAPAAEGMSGGPLFHLKDNRLNVFSVITEGEGDEEKGCHWF